MDDVVELGMEAVQNHDKILDPKGTLADIRKKKHDQEARHKRRQYERQQGFTRKDQLDGRNERQRRESRDQPGRDDYGELPLGGVARRPGMNRRASSLDRGRFEKGRRYSDSDGSSTDTASISSHEDTKMVRRKKGKEILTASLATVATLHAGKKVYDSFGAAHKRHKAVRQGKMTQEEADKKKYVARAMETASIGIAVLGLKGVYDEWKEVHDHHKEYEEHKEKRERHQEKIEKNPQRRRSESSGSGSGDRYRNGSRERYGGRGRGRGEYNPSRRQTATYDENGAGEYNLSRRQTTAYDGDVPSHRHGQWSSYAASGEDLGRRQTTAYDGRGRTDSYAASGEDLTRRQTTAYDGDTNNGRDDRDDSYGKWESRDDYDYSRGNRSSSQYGNHGDWSRRRSVPNLRER